MTIPAGIFKAYDVRGLYPQEVDERVATLIGRALAEQLGARRMGLGMDPRPSSPALGEAFARAAERWPRDGVPADPPAWLYTTAHRHVLGRLRAEAVAGRKAPLLVVRSEPPAAPTGCTLSSIGAGYRKRWPSPVA